jgi:hypothetical protein
MVKALMEKTTVELPTSTVPAVYVQFLPVRMILDKVRVPPVLFMVSGIKSPTVAEPPPVRVWLLVPLMVKVVGVPELPSKVETKLISP